MTKTLTEQWREGTLERGYYYYKTKVGVKVIGYQCFGLKFPYDHYHNTIDSVKEVLAPVPSYDEHQALKYNCELTHTRLKGAHQKIDILEKQLAIATKALEYYAQCKHLNLDILSMLLDKHKKEFADFEVYEDGEIARKVLKEMEGVK